MASLTAIRSGIKDTVEAAIPDIQGYNTVPEVANLPAFVVVPGPADFAVAMGRGVDTYEFDVIVLVSPRDHELGQYDLDEYLTGAGTKSVRQAIWNAKTLGLADTEAFVYASRNYGAQFAIGDLPHIGAVLKVRVTTPGTA